MKSQEITAPWNTENRIPDPPRSWEERHHQTDSNAVYFFKNRCRVATSRAIKRGILTRQPCEECGLEKVDAHHEDYSKPLEVRWLCRAHHAALHVAKNQARALALKPERDLQEAAQRGTDAWLAGRVSVEQEKPATTSPEDLPT